MYRDLVKRAFAVHKGDAKRRGIPFLLTYEQWCMVWMESGKFEQRGRHRGCYVMSRPGDKGAYELGNVVICVAAANTAERNRLNTNEGKKYPRMSEVMRDRMKDPDRRQAIRERMIVVAAARVRDERGCFIREC